MTGKPEARRHFTVDRSSCLVIQTAFLGDVVLTTPLLSVLAARHGPVDVVTTPAAAGLLEGHPAVRSVLRYDKRGSDRGWGGLRRMGRELRERSYSRVYLPHRSLRSAALALWSGAPERVGFADAPGAISYTSRVTRPATGHEVERILALTHPASEEHAPVSLPLTDEDLARADAWLASKGVGARFAALAPGSIWGTKRWPYYPKLAARLDRMIVVVGGADDVALANAVAAAAPDRVVNAAGALSLRESAAVIQRASVLVTNDSAPLHLGTAVGTPIVALFGPTVPEFGFGPRRAGDVTLGHTGLSCRPCSSHGPLRCPLGHHRCMRDLPVDAVLEAIATIVTAEESGAICPRN
ncbi:MAG: lipopolysaccharide heptosyltransferase II [Gemmatimonadales bacterium]